MYWTIRALTRDPEIELQLVATGAHLSPEFGLTCREIESDGFQIDGKVEMLLSSDTAVGITTSIGIGVIGFASMLDRLKPHVMVVLGDRFEIFAAAQAALIARIPIAHISGGDTTEGAYDEAIRHSLTKMAHLHFVTNTESARRVRQMGEDPKSIFQFGAPQLEHLRRTELLSRVALEDSIKFRFRERNILVTFHPVTLDRRSSQDQFAELLAALAVLPHDVGFIFTLPNADCDGRVLIEMTNDFARHQGDRAVAIPSLGRVRYLSTLAQVDVVAGNSSSGIVEAPSFCKPTVNIGARQRGRTRAASVIDVDAERSVICHALKEAFTLDCSEVINPYGDGETAKRIVEVLRHHRLEGLLQKRFWPMEAMQ
jgi:UDP-N-acetylglucosamine 2-epimerase (non-hydrolysing)/GDP/UDP-N,N'-diacetylbacillosamine 2-epimerase (hydrolysing)